MNYVLNLKTRELSPIPMGETTMSREFIGENAVVVSAEQAQIIGNASHDERERIVTSILGQKMLKNDALPDAARKILLAGLDALGAGANSADVFNVEESEADGDVSVTLDTTGVGALLKKSQIAKLGHPKLLAYARNVLGLDCADNEPFEIIKAKVYAAQFADDEPGTVARSV